MRIIKGVLIILTIAIGLAFIANSLFPSGIPLIGQWDLSQGVIRAKGDNKAVDNSGFEIDNVDLAKKIYDQGSTVFIDARSEESYRDGHIKGAVAFPVGEFNNRIDYFSSHYPIDQPIVTYCSGRSCEDSHRLAQMLMDSGYRQVSVMIDGYPGWEARGFPVE